MSPVLIAAALLASSFQKPPSDNIAYPDVSDNHFVYATLSDLRAGGLLPELDPDDLLTATHPLTRGKIGQYVVEATINLQRFVDQHRRISSVGTTTRYSDTVSTLTGNQITYLVALTPPHPPSRQSPFNEPPALRPLGRARSHPRCRNQTDRRPPRRGIAGNAHAAAASSGCF